MAKQAKSVSVAIVTELGIDLSHVAMASDALKAKMAEYAEGTKFTAAIRDFDSLATEIAIGAGLQIKHVEPTDWQGHKVHSTKLDKDVNLGAIFSAAAVAGSTKMLVLVQPKPMLGDRMFQNSALLAAAMNGAEVVLVRPVIERVTQ